jgi:prolyl-tRNA synthetase
MIGAVADTLADEKGLNWPRIMAPFEAVIVPTIGLDNDAVTVYDALSAPLPTPSQYGFSKLDIVLDDRLETFAWKMRDADLVGYPVIIVVGRKWKTERICEVQCRRLQICEEVAFPRLYSFLESLLLQL